MRESIIDIEVIEDYEKETGKKWSKAEEQMAEICSFFDYGFQWNKEGNIVINNQYYEGTFENQEGMEQIYTFFGKDIEKSEGEKFNNVCLPCDFRHYEYQSAEDMVQKWSDTCKKTNAELVEKGLEKAFAWLD